MHKNTSLFIVVAAYATTDTDRYLKKENGEAMAATLTFSILQPLEWYLECIHICAPRMAKLQLDFIPFYVTLLWSSTLCARLNYILCVQNRFIERRQVSKYNLPEYHLKSGTWKSSSLFIIFNFWTTLKVEKGCDGFREIAPHISHYYIRMNIFITTLSHMDFYSWYHSCPTEFAIPQRHIFFRALCKEK